MVPHNWVGKKIIDLSVRKKDSINILAVANKGQEPMLVGPDYVFVADDTVFVFTNEKSIKKYTNK